MPGLPIVTGIERSTNGVTVTWDGPSGYYQLLQKLGLKDAKWQTVGAPNATRKTTVAANENTAFFTVSGPSPRYAGSQACLECHRAVHSDVVNTRHTGAFTNAQFVAQGGQTNSSCVACHTVGFGLPTGFISKSRTPHLAGVQCENCHGPAANHAASPEDLSVRPRIEIAATVCGGCHTAPREPTFEQWKSTRHATVVEDMNPTNRITSCGQCHSGSVRLSLLKNDPLPVGDANVAIGCVTCHDPHRQHVHTNVLSGLLTVSNALTRRFVVFTNDQVGTLYTNQLRNPLSSTNDYFVTTSGVFSNQYNPNINACAQCHNHRGAAWTSSSRPPHHSPQYNMLLGTVGELDTGAAPHFPASHAFLEKQCVSCHMPKHSAGEAAVSSHEFKVTSYESCRACHPNGEGLVTLTQTGVSMEIQRVKAWLDMWAATKAPAALWAKYGMRAWEYSTPGELSPGGSGPTSSEQAQIPDAIKKARFNLYLVLNDGSYGVHNGPYSVKLLDIAEDWVLGELSK
jgi:hypothetical protein